jgi:hypothetical protein
VIVEPFHRKEIMMKSIAFALMVATAAGVGFAGQIAPADVAPGARWVVHVDVEALVASQMGQYAIAQIQQQGLSDKLQGFIVKFGSDPTKDLAGVTLYGTGFDLASGVAIFKGKFDKPKLFDLLNQNEGHEQTAYGNYAIHRWVEPPHQMRHPGGQYGGFKDDGVRVGAFRNEDTIVIGHSAGALTAALDVLDGKGAGTADVIPKVAPGTIFLAAGKDFQAAQRPTRQSWMLQGISGGVVQAGESSGTSFLNVALTARSAEDGDRIRQMLNGLLAFASAMAQGTGTPDRPAPPWAPLIQGLQVGGTADSVSLTATVETAKLIEIAGKAHEFHGHRHWRHKESN